MGGGWGEGGGEGMEEGGRGEEKGVADNSLVGTVPS